MISALIIVDRLVGFMIAGLMMAVVVAVRWRGPRQLRRVVVVTTLIITSAGVVTAIALPVYAQRSTPLLVNLTPEGEVSKEFPVTSGRPRFEILGYVASDYEDSAAGVDRDASLVTGLAPTSVSLGSVAGSLEVSDASDTLIRAHAARTPGLLVVSNFDGTDFNGRRVESLLANRQATSQFISSLTRLVAKQGWDGVVIDFEKLTPAVRGSFPGLLHDLRGALGSRTLDVAVPGFIDPTDPDLVAYDLPNIARQSDRITWMAYDEHELSTMAGPVASLAWVKSSLSFALTRVPASKLLLGVASYGYAWKSPGHAEEFSAQQFRAMVAAHTATFSWDTKSGEWHGRLRDGRTAWFSDGESMRVRTQLALDNGLGGIALWRVGADEVDALDRLPILARRATSSPTVVAPNQRTIKNVQAGGIVALTFDDGPDPKWTPKILAILQREHVPATFFVIGQQAQQHSALVASEVRFGDVVANHTYSHKDLSTLSVWHAKLEISAGAAVIEGITGHNPRLFRSPYGRGDRSSKKLGADQLANDLGEHAVGWNVDPLDWSTPGTNQIVHRVERDLQERSIVLLHDGGGDRSQTVAALPGIIKTLRAKHYLFTTVDGLDGAVSAPYRSRSGPASSLRGLAIISGFRLWVATRSAFLILLMGIAGISIIRLLVAGPLAVAQALSTQRRGDRPPSVASRCRMVSVVVPAHNEELVIAKTLLALFALRHPGGREYLEVLVIDDGSTDSTFATALATVESAGSAALSTRVISQRASKKAGALNRAFAESRGEVVIVVDADTVVDPAMVEAMLGHFDDPRVGAVAGNVRVGNTAKLFGKLQALEYVVALNLDRRAQAAANVMAVVPGAAGAFRRIAVLDAGGYSTDTLVEDADLTVSLLGNGWRIPYEPKAVAFTEAPQTVRDVVKQRRRWAYGTVEVLRKHQRDLLSRRAGRVGLLGLPWMLLSQVVLPVVGPVCDVFLLYLIAVQNFGELTGILALAVVSDLLFAGLILMLNREPLRMLFYVPLLRMVWRPLQLYAVCASTGRWLSGRGDEWRKVQRYNAVVVR